jgi:putative hemolysin
LTVNSQKELELCEEAVAIDNPLLQELFLTTGGVMQRVLSLDKLDETYKAAAAGRTDETFFDGILDVLNVNYEIAETDFSQIPREGPVVVVSNHPYGGIDGIILGSILHSVRPDFKIMANYLLGKIQQLREFFILVDPFGARHSVETNLKPLKATLKHLNGEGMVAVFPAGEVAHFKLAKFEVREPEWTQQIARIVRKTKTPVLPVYFDGSNSVLFQSLGLVHPWLRTLMLPREVVNKANKHVKVKVGRLVSFNKLNKFGRDADMLKYLRMRTLMLRNRDQEKKTRIHFKGKNRCRKLESVVPPHDPQLLHQEIQALLPEQHLLETDRFKVMIARAGQIPCLTYELCRLREITFREVNEGTGKSIDTDCYDEHYLHLFLWSKENRELVGAYRLGPTDEIIPKRGLEGLYTYTLFEYGNRFLDQINPAIELGRSFVRVEYQKSYQPLMLLWKGIGTFVSRNPQYRMLFGPVSINSEYNSNSRKLMVAFLRENKQCTDLARLVKARNPLKRRVMKGREVKSAAVLLQDIQELSEMVSELEEDQKGIPILVKQYVKLGGHFLGFSVDHNFSDVLDALILVDLTQTEPRLLERYMGKEGSASFISYHRSKYLDHTA